MQASRIFSWASFSLLVAVLGFALVSFTPEKTEAPSATTAVAPPGFFYDFGCGTEYQEVAIPCAQPGYACGQKNVFEFGQKFKVKNCEKGKALSEKFVKEYLEIFCALNTKCCEEAGCEAPFCKLAKFDVECKEGLGDCESVLVIQFAIVYGCKGS